jgi:hypothetical protein
MAFKIPTSAAACPADPESLFRDLRKRTVPGLLSHQADLIRTYVQEHEATPDVALQLPTGSGKTLVGLLIAEWRRRKYRHRCVYLCPTRQLVNQVVEQSHAKYGLDVLGFTGSKAKYESIDKMRWLNGEAIAVTTYSSLFNINPFFEDAGLIVLDDAHAAENYIASQWSLAINSWKPEHKSVYAALAGFLRSLLPLADRGKLGADTSRAHASWVDVIPMVRLYPQLSELRTLLDEHTEGSDLSYQWHAIKDSLEACSIYCTCDSILIRPLIPPTFVHNPFAAPAQRLYMSATLGAGGDLERITGRKNIARVEIPLGWDKQGTGRRFFMFPERSLDDAATHSLLLKMIEKAGRALYLTPDDRTAAGVRDQISESAKINLYTASELEDSKDPFVAEKSAVAVVANRYDGIDLIDDECRLLVLDGFPRGTNLQEKFFTLRMGASILLDDRILTRIVQGFGRCTRSATDFSAVVVLGDALQAYLLRSEKRSVFHPEMQAEIEFGIAQSVDTSQDEMLKLANLFWSQSDDWEHADNAILSLREKMARQQLPCISELMSAVADEIGYQQCAWHNDHLGALSHCKKVLSKLLHPDLRGYRALWLYLAGSAAWLARKNDHLLEGDAIARDYFDQARSTVPGLRFLLGLGQSEEGKDTTDSSSAVMQLVERMEGVIAKLGIVHDRDFDAVEKEIRRDLWQTKDGVQFEQGHLQLGKLLGYDAENRSGSGEPDPWWLVDHTFGFVFEDNAEGNPESALGTNKARQAASHPAWIKAEQLIEPQGEIVAVLITPKTSAEKSALPSLESVKYWYLVDFLKWADNAINVVRELRRDFPGAGNLVWRSRAAEALRRHAIAPAELDSLLNRSAAEALAPE